MNPNKQADSRKSLTLLSSTVYLGKASLDLVRMSA